MLPYTENVRANSPDTIRITAVRAAALSRGTDRLLEGILREAHHIIGENVDLLPK